MPALPPCPYASPADDDLTDVVTHLTPRATRNGTVPRDPNETEVRWLLEAGLRALGETVLAAPPDHADHCAYTNSNGIFDTLPLERVMTSYRDMCLEQGLDPGSANKARLIRRWSFAANYQLDLIAYLFRPATAEHRISALQATIDEAIGGSTIGELVDTFSASPALFPVDDPHYRLQRALSIMFPDSTTITEHRAEITLEPITEAELTHLAETAALATTPGAMDAIEDTFTPRAATATLPAGDGLQPA